MLCGQINAVPLIVAHRGASQEAPENTLAAFKLAWAQNADAIEGDFHLTGNGEVVCIHDADTQRVAGTRLIVKNATLEELRILDVGAWRGKEWAGTRIATIAEVLATVPNGKKIYAEIKGGPAMLPRLLEEIKNAGLRNEQIVLLSFNAEVMQTAKFKAPQFKTLWLSGFRQATPGGAPPSLEPILATLKQINADGFSSAYDTISAPIVKRILKEGYEYHVWTIDDPKTARNFAQWGAQSITTNVPGFMKENLGAQDAPKNADARGH